MKKRKRKEYRKDLQYEIILMQQMIAMNLQNAEE